MTKLTALLIDDDEPTGVYNEIIIRQSKLFSSWKIVVSVTEALSYLESADQVPDVIFLDINMPVHNGWDFLSKYEELDIPQKCQNIYMLSTSSRISDIEKSKKFENVKGFKEKPLKHSLLEEIACAIQQMSSNNKCYATSFSNNHT